MNSAKSDTNSMMTEWSGSENRFERSVYVRIATRYWTSLAAVTSVVLATGLSEAQTVKEGMRIRPLVAPQTQIVNSISSEPNQTAAATWRTVGYLQDEESQAGTNDGSAGTLEARLGVLEAELKKSKEAAAKKKEEDAKKKEEDAKKPVVKPRGRLHTDLNYFGQSNLNRERYGDIQDGAYFRRARLGFDAKILEVTEWRLDFEMASGGGRPSIFDAYVRVTDLPRIGNLQLGHFREPFSLEALTSSNWLTFIERSANNTFDPSRNWGIMTFDCSDDERMTWAAGVFRDGSDNFGDDIGDSGEWAGTARSTYLLQYDEASEGRCFWEVGASYSYRDPDKRFAVNSASGPPSGAETSIVNYSMRPEDNLNEDGIGRTPNLLNVSITDANNVQLYGIETTRNFGSLNLQSEFIAAAVNRSSAADVFYHGAYFQASYFLTGESRRWDKKAGTFGRAEVLAPFLVEDGKNANCTGLGAWELIGRWNYLNLNDGNVGSLYGAGNSTTIGFNWYLNSYVYLQVNYDYSDVPYGGPGTGGNVHAYHARWNMHF